MKNAVAAPALAALMILGGCSAIPRGAPVGAPVVAVPGAELYNRSVRVESGGRTSVMTFRPDGQVSAVFNGQTVNGRWAIEGQRLCFTWGTFRDCWPYAGLWRRGVTTNLTSDRGTAVRLTLL